MMIISDEITQREHARKQDTDIQGTFPNWFALYNDVIDQYGGEAETYLQALLEDGAYDQNHLQRLAIRAALARARWRRERSGQRWEEIRSWSALTLSAIAISVTVFSIFFRSGN